MSDNNTNNTLSDDTEKLIIVLVFLIVLFLITSIAIGYFVWGISPANKRVVNTSESVKTIALCFTGIGAIINIYFATQRTFAMLKTAEAANKNALALAKTAEIGAHLRVGGCGGKVRK